MAAEFHFPDDLVQLQHEWFDAETAWKEAEPGEPAAAAYRRVHELTLALHRHKTMREAENHHEMREALRKAARQEG